MSRKSAIVKRTAGIVISLVAVIALVGCSPQGIDISPEDRALQPCVGIDSVTVEELAALAPVDCDWSEVTVVYPDGFTKVAPSIGVTSGSSSGDIDLDESVTYSMWNLGLDGVIAARTAPRGATTEWWGSARGIERVQEVEGVDIPPIVQ